MDAIRYAMAPCALGRLLVAATERGLCHVALGDRDGELLAELRREFPCAALERDDPAVAGFVESVAAAIAGDPSPLEVPLDVRGSRLQRRVWAALCGIPHGTTRTYGELAKRVGMPRGARAVARACATNPLAVVVPCHRVVPAAGGPGGYRHGSERKRRLLEAELAASVGRAQEPRLVGSRTR